jgi:signal transduction histidine kinase
MGDEEESVLDEDDLTDPSVTPSRMPPAKNSGMFSRERHKPSDKEKFEEQRAINVSFAQIIHDINNVLAFLRYELDFRELDQANTETISNRIEMIQELVKQTLTISQIIGNPEMTLNIVPVDLRMLIEQTLGIMKSRFEIEVGNEVGLAYVDTLQFGRLLLNLFSNAIKYCPDPNSKITVILDEDEENQYISVCDRGIGLTDKQEQLFDLKIQTQILANGGSNGLGLVLCKIICDAHDAQLIAKNNSDGPGATFTVKLPKKVY